MAKGKLPSAEHAPALARFREIAAASGDRLLLGDGPPNPDAELLDLCSDALHHLSHAEKTYRSRDSILEAIADHGDWTDGDRAKNARLMHVYYDGIARAKPPLVLITKMPAKTAAGIYAKALLVRASRTGAQCLAMSLAEDLVNNPGLRAALWSEDAVPSSGGV